MKLIADRPLGGFSFVKDRQALIRFKKELARELKNSFQLGIINPPKTGIKYPNLPNRSSRVNEFPANQTGALLRSVNSSYNEDSVTVGSNKYYSRFLAEGTVRMGIRKMSKYVLQKTNKDLPNWIKIKTR